MAENTRKAEDKVIQSAAEPATPDEFVQVKKSDLERLISTVSRQSKDIEVLYKVADQNRMAKLHQVDAEVKLIRTCRVWKWINGKFIVATKLVSNTAEIVNGRYFEDQKLQLMFNDGTTTEVTYLDFARNNKHVVAEIVNRTARSNGIEGQEEVMFKVQLADGLQLELDSRFTN